MKDIKHNFVFCFCTIVHTITSFIYQNICILNKGSAQTSTNVEQKN